MNTAMLFDFEQLQTSMSMGGRSRIWIRLVLERREGGSVRQYSVCTLMPIAFVLEPQNKRLCEAETFTPLESWE